MMDGDGPMVCDGLAKSIRTIRAIRDHPHAIEAIRAIFPTSDSDFEAIPR